MLCLEQGLGTGNWSTARVLGQVWALEQVLRTNVAHTVWGLEQGLWIVVSLEQGVRIGVGSETRSKNKFWAFCKE